MVVQYVYIFISDGAIFIYAYIEFDISHVIFEDWSFLKKGFEPEIIHIYLFTYVLDMPCFQITISSFYLLEWKNPLGI